MTVSPTEGPTDSQRQQALATAVQKEVARGARVESQSAYSAIVRYGKPVNHVLHLILTVLTLGFWLLVWVTLVVLGIVKRKAVALQVDEFGNVLRQKV